MRLALDEAAGSAAKRTSLPRAYVRQMLGNEPQRAEAKFNAIRGLT
jgi:hypothetical protein